jgi:hypothetical protein
MCQKKKKKKEEEPRKEGKTKFKKFLFLSPVFSLFSFSLVA